MLYSGFPLFVFYVELYCSCGASPLSVCLPIRQICCVVSFYFSLLKIWPGVRESNPRLKIRSLLYFPLYERQQFGSRSRLRSLPFRPIWPVSRVYKSRPHSSAICHWGIIRVSISCYRIHKPGCCHYTNDTIEWCEVKESNL